MVYFKCLGPIYTHWLLESWIHMNNFMNLENLFEFLGLITLSAQLQLHFQLIEPRNLNKFSKFMKLFR